MIIIILHLKTNYKSFSKNTMETKSYIIGVDFGTTSLSVVLVKTDDWQIERVINRETNAYIESSNTLVKEQSIKILVDSFNSVMEEINSLPNIHIAAYGFTGQMHGIVGLDKNNNAVTNLVTWEDRSGETVMDNATKMIDTIKTLAGDDTISCGYGIVTLYKWLVVEKRTDISSFCTIADYFVGLITHKIAMSPSMAHSIGLFDISTNTWNRRSIEKLGLDYQLFPLVVSESSLLGYAGDVPVFSAIGDNQASFMGAVSGTKKSMVLNVGTGTQISVLLEKGEVNKYNGYIDGVATQLRPYDNDYYLMATSFINGGATYRSLFNFMKEIAVSLFNLENIDENQLWSNMEKSAGFSIEEGDPLKVLPLLSYERNDFGKNGEITNITSENFHPGNLIAGFLKGLSENYKSALNPNILEKTDFIYGGGNGLKKNKVFVQILEQTFGKPIYLTSYDEEAAVGAAMNAAKAIQIEQIQKI
ncbi:sedoheptulokinase [Chryseobacterium pennae]|nr:FGGY family carbohydrate kinase [Chryseobacterium pennae]